MVEVCSQCGQGSELLRQVLFQPFDFLPQEAPISIVVPWANLSPGVIQRRINLAPGPQHLTLLVTERLHALGRCAQPVVQGGLQGLVLLLQRTQPAQVQRAALVDQGEHFVPGDFRVQAADPLACDFFPLSATAPAQWIAATLARQHARRSKKRQLFRRHAQGFAQRCSA